MLIYKSQLVKWGGIHVPLPAYIFVTLCLSLYPCLSYLIHQRDLLMDQMHQFVMHSLYSVLDDSPIMKYNETKMYCLINIRAFDCTNFYMQNERRQIQNYKTVRLLATGISYHIKFTT